MRVLLRVWVNMLGLVLGDQRLPARIETRISQCVSHLPLNTIFFHIQNQRGDSLRLGTRLVTTIFGMKRKRSLASCWRNVSTTLCCLPMKSTSHGERVSLRRSSLSSLMTLVSDGWYCTERLTSGCFEDFS